MLIVKKLLIKLVGGFYLYVTVVKGGWIPLFSVCMCISKLLQKNLAGFCAELCNFSMNNPDLCFKFLEPLMLF